MADLFSGALAQTTPSTFSFGTHAIRIIARDGEPWFVASDVAAALGYRDAANAGRILSDRQKADTQIVSTSSNGAEQARAVTIINESGLYRLVLRSRKPEAAKFSDWVTGEVLPSIRKTGGYAKPTADAVLAIEPTDAPAMAAARKVALDYFTSYRKAVSEGKTWVDMDTIPSAALQGMIADAIMRQRMLISFSPDSGRMSCTALGHDEFISSWQRLVKDIASGECLRTSAELADLAAACSQRLARRLAP